MCTRRLTLPYGSSIVQRKSEALKRLDLRDRISLLEPFEDGRDLPAQAEVVTQDGRKGGLRAQPVLVLDNQSLVQEPKT